MSDTERLLPPEPVPDLDAWIDAGGGEGLARALEVGPDEVIEEVDRAGLRGRGGAGFPTATKWRGVLETAGDTGAPVYVVCNAAEGEPGTYKDRSLIEANPYAVVEGILIAAHAVGAQAAFIGVKGKFASSVERLRDAVAEAARVGWRGADSVEIVTGPDEYLFGEEKAMLEVIEGKLPMPRIVPPYQQGLFATITSPNPTVVNNVETLAHVTRILANGSDWFRQLGTESSPGTMIFTVTGDVANPGVYELPLGTPLRTLLHDIAGAENIKAVFSGVSNAVITPRLLDTPLDFDSMRSAGSGLGSGGFVVYDDSRSIVDVLSTLMHFLAIESCGQCNACKLGTGDMANLLSKIQAGEAERTDLEALLRRSQSVTDQNRCYLPVGAQVMVASTVEVFVDEFVATVESGKPTPGSVPVPLIESIDDADGQVEFDGRYHLKQPDWSYADQDPGEARLRAILPD